MEVIRVPSPQPIPQAGQLGAVREIGQLLPVVQGPVQTFQAGQPGQEGKIVVRVALVNGQLLQILHLTDVFDILCRQLHLPQAEVCVI